MPDARAVAIDIPIGLPETGRREADDAARSLLGYRRSSTAVSTRLTGFGVSRQSFALAAKMLEVERWIAQAGCPIYEVHPEVSFERAWGVYIVATFIAGAAR